MKKKSIICFTFVFCPTVPSTVLNGRDIERKNTAVPALKETGKKYIKISLAEGQRGKSKYPKDMVMKEMKRSRGLGLWW